MGPCLELRLGRRSLQRRRWDQDWAVGTPAVGRSKAVGPLMRKVGTRRKKKRKERKKRRRKKRSRKKRRTKKRRRKKRRRKKRKKRRTSRVVEGKGKDLSLTSTKHVVKR